MKSIVVLLTLFTLCQENAVSSTPLGDNSCPKGWIRFSDTDHCFYISEKFDTFDDANNFCKKQNTHLAPSLTIDAYIDLSEFLGEHRKKCPLGQNCDEFWIGIHNLTGDKWRTGNGLEIERNAQCQPWARDFPKTNAGRCAIMSFKATRRNRGSWRNTNCTRKLKYACITCPNNFEYIPEIDECLSFNRIRANWSVARQMCSKVKRRAQLLTIQYQMKQEAVTRYVQSHLAKPESSACEYWRWNSLGRLIWTGGQTANPNECNTPYIWKPVGAAPIPFSYTNWVPGMPNCGYSVENCMVLATAPVFNCRWEDILCSDVFCYVCEF